MNNEKVLIIYEDFSAGGSTTSLFALLNAWDHERYGVDLLPYRLSDGERKKLISRLPSWVNLLENAVKHGNSPINKVIKGVKLLPSAHFHKAMKARKAGENKYVVLQHMGYAKVGLCRRITENYRAAIAFIEGWSTSYLLSRKVKADRKIAFVHLDYKTSGMDAEIDREALGKAYRIVAVSESCRRGLAEIYREYADKIVKIENLHQTDRIKALARESLDGSVEERFDFLTVCRPDIWVKGLDRLVDAAAELRGNGYSFKWAVVGVGEDQRFSSMIAEKGLKGCVIPFAATENPYPFFLRSDWFVLTSRTEAKPMTVTEAQILGVPCIVTEYSSAAEQIKNGVDGIITENSLGGIISALKNALDKKELRGELASAIDSGRYDSEAELEKLYGMIE